MSNGPTQQLLEVITWVETQTPVGLYDGVNVGKTVGVKNGEIVGGEDGVIVGEEHSVSVRIPVGTTLGENVHAWEEEGVPVKISVGELITVPSQETHFKAVR